MDVATQLVQAYLHVNGYFTATEYPIIEAQRDHPPRTLTDMIVSEIKQGKAQINPGSRNHQVLTAALTRFGRCDATEMPSLVQALLQRGRAKGAAGHVIRMVLFASRGERAPHGWHWVHLDHVFRYLEDYLFQQQRLLGGVDLRDPALAWLSLLHKCDLTLNPKRGLT